MGRASTGETQFMPSRSGRMPWRVITHGFNDAGRAQNQHGETAGHRISLRLRSGQIILPGRMANFACFAAGRLDIAGMR